jgi:hypothetical protein
MSSILHNGPAVEPLSLAEAKAFLRVEHADDDDIVTALVAGARIQVEAQTRRALVAQSSRLIRDVWPTDGRIATCRDRFDNFANFRGFPQIPGNDFVISYPVPGQGTNDGKSFDADR